MGIALGLNVVNDSTLATTSREITAGGDVTFAAHASASTLAGAKASAAGAEEETKAAETATAAKKMFDEQKLLRLTTPLIWELITASRPATPLSTARALLPIQPSAD